MYHLSGIMWDRFIKSDYIVYFNRAQRILILIDITSILSKFIKNTLDKDVDIPVGKFNNGDNFEKNIDICL